MKSFRAVTFSSPFPGFILTLRNPNFKPYVTDGSLLPFAKSEMYMMFLGAEDTEFPLFIISKITPPPRGEIPQSFYGVVQRRHHNNDTMFAMPVYFGRSKHTEPIAQYPSDKLGSWPEEEAIRLIKPDIGDIEHILESLRRRRGHDGRGGLIVGDHD